jgi:KDO2-lipid IV(A) lauroyltransferase
MGPELLARALRSNAYYVSMRRLARGQYEIEFVPLNTAGEKPPTGAITERYARALERDIQADPAGWWWSHRRWKLKMEERVTGSG